LALIASFFLAGSVILPENFVTFIGILPMWFFLYFIKQKITNDLSAHGSKINADLTAELSKIKAHDTGYTTEAKKFFING